MSHRLMLSVLAGTLALSACGTPQERCIRRETSEYRAVNGLLAETRANLARGYAWAERDVVTWEMDFCRYPVRRRNGRHDWVTYPCDRQVVDTVQYRVPIDPASEERKRDYLAERLKALRAPAEASVRACKAAYPEAPKASPAPAPG